MKSISESIKESYTVNENNEMTGEEYAAYYDGMADAIEGLKFPQLKKYYKGMPNYTGDAKELIMTGLAHAAAWIRGVAASDADDDPEGYDYTDSLTDILTSNDPSDFEMMIEDFYNDDYYEELVHTLSEDGDGEVVRWFEGDFLVEFFNTFVKKYK